jgi:hypothetical protein
VTVEQGEPHQQEMPLGKYVDYIRTGSKFKDLRSTLPYLRGVMVAEVLPELMADFEVLPYFEPNWLSRPQLRPFLPLKTRRWIDLFIGPPGVGFPNLHYDSFMTHNWFSQIYGTKHFWTFAQDQRPYLYADDEYPSESELGELPPDLETYPLYEKAVCTEFDLHPGELLFIPAGRWHTTKMTSMSISLSGNFVNETNFDDFERELRLHGDRVPVRLLRSRLGRKYVQTTNRLIDRVLPR